jgi:Outer membrane protein beta-barrel domain
MKNTLYVIFCLTLLAAKANAGTETRVQSSTEEAPPNGWYASREFNVQLWGTYIFSANEYARSFQSETRHLDRYLSADHAWGGGLDLKYFVNRHIGFGLEGYAVSAQQTVSYLSFFLNTESKITLSERRLIGAGLGTVTFRYPIGASRFAPYGFAGGGVIAGGGQRLKTKFISLLGQPPGTNPIQTFFSDGKTEALGQFGAGLEIRVTPRVGVITDFSWNVLEGQDNNFGMLRSGVSVAF